MSCKQDIPTYMLVRNEPHLATCVHTLDMFVRLLMLDVLTSD